MEFMQYRMGTSFQGSSVVGQNDDNGGMSVKDLAFAMRQDFFVDDSSAVPKSVSSAAEYGVNSAATGVHVQPGAVSLRVNGVGNLADPQRITHFDQRSNEVEQFYQHDDQQVVNFRQSSQEMIEDQSYSGNGYHGLHIQPSHVASVSIKSGNPPQQNYVPNGTVRHGQPQPQLASQFYQQLRMSWGPSQQSEEHQVAMSPSGEHYHQSLPEYQGISVVPTSNGAVDFEPDISPRMLPKPPQEPRRGSRTRSSLRRAANLLLNRSRQSLSDGETTRKPMPPTTTRSEMEQRKEAKTQTIRERLQKNKNRMGELLRSPNLSRMRRSSQGNISTDSSLSPTDMPRSKSSSRKYASAENLQVNGYNRSVENLSSRRGPQSGSDRNSVRMYEGNSSRSEDNDHDIVHSRVPSPGYKLRRHASGPVYQESDKMQANSYHRGYHTADSDTDSGVGRVNGYSAQTHPRTDGHKGMPSTRDTLRLIQKKRDVSGPSSRHMNKSVSGPLKADHSIQPVRTADECSPMDKSGMWIEQGARPKRSSSVESLETEEVKHEIFPDSQIGMCSQASHKSRSEKQQRKPRASSLTRSDQDDRRPTSRGTRPASPARSVHFEDSDSPRDKQEERRKPHSRSQSRTKVSPPENGSASTRNHLIQGDDGYSYAKPDKSNKHNSCSDIEDPYATIPDHHSRVVGDIDNPYEEIQIPDCHDINRNHITNPSRNAGNQDRSSEWEDSIDGLYAKVEKKRQSRKNEKRGVNCTTQKQEVINDSRENVEPIYAKVDKTSKRPPSGAAHRPSSRQRSHSDRPSKENPCIAKEFDDSISQMGNEANNGRQFKSNLEDYAELSGSRLSISSRASVSDKMQSIGKATKKKLSSMRRALSLDRINTAGNENTENEQPKLKRSPSLRSLTGLFSKKDKKQDNSDKPGKLNKRRSASLSGLPIRLQRSSEETDVTSPSHMRKVGKLLHLNSDGSQVVELVKPPSGPFGFYIARGTSNFGSGVFVTRLGDGHPAKILVGLLAVGDEILEINGVDVRNRPLDDVYDMMMDNNKLTLRLVPISSRGTWTDRSYRGDV